MTPQQPVPSEDQLTAANRKIEDLTAALNMALTIQSERAEAAEARAAAGEKLAGALRRLIAEAETGRDVLQGTGVVALEQARAALAAFEEGKK
jgi:hypothetical protein